MGADGGVNWMRVKYHERFHELVTKPFQMYLGDRSEHSDYLDKHPLPKDCIVLSYGTDQELHGFETLKDMIDEAEIVGSFFYPNQPDITFADLMLDVYTGPRELKEKIRARSTIERALFIVTGLHRYVVSTLFPMSTAEHASLQRELQNAQTHPVWSMSVRSWGAVVRGLIDRGSYGSAETWT